MGKQFSTLLSTALVAALCGTASAYTLNGTVTGKDGKAIQGADVKLLTFRRPERRFHDIAELKHTMEKDIRAGKIYHGIEDE